MSATASPRKKLILAAGVLALVVTGLFLLWRHTSLAEYVTAGNVIDRVEHFSGKWWAPIVMVLAYTPASLVMFPRPLITLAAVVAFGPWYGFAIAMTGALVNALAGYYAGRNFDEKRIKRMAGPRLERLTRMLKKEGFVAVAVVGLLPVAPFFVEMVVAGAIRIKVLHLLLGVSLAMLPGTLGTTILGDQLAAVLSNERELNRWIVVAVVAVMAALAWGTQRYWKRLQAMA